MLKHLRITNFAILSDVELDLAPGFNVLTGETGAGKSLIVDAVALLRGGRASADIPRAGADEAVVEAVFEPPADMRAEVEARLERAGLKKGDDGEILVRRVISRGGRSRVHVNGGLTTVAILGGLAEVLVDLAGQHEHQGLVDPSRHLAILDAFGVDPALGRAAEDVFERMRAAQEALEALEGDERVRAEREDFLRFQVEEIDTAALRPDEETALAGDRERLRAAGKLGAAARRGEDALYASEDSVVDILAGLLRELEPLVPIDARLDGPTRQVSEARVLLEDAASALRRYGENIEDDPARLAELDDRLHLIQRLCRKHGASAAEVLARREVLAAELADLSSRDERRTDLARQVQAARAEAEAIAAKLTAARRKAGARLAKEVGAALTELGMGGGSLEVAIEPRPLGPAGADRVELLLCANKGEEPRPLAKIASGGELSRIMLAMKLSLRRAEAVATYVFDEVDAGIGGGTAEVVGRQILRVADERQVICVTHLAQIAALADCHFFVRKFQKDGRTETSVTQMSAADRREEVARMLGGLEITSRTRAHAKEMLSRAARR